MKKLLTLFLFLLSCQPLKISNSSSSDAGEAIKTYLNPWLISIQQMTVEINSNSNEWPTHVNDYSKIYGDSSKLILNYFDEFNIHNMDDSLIVNYRLKKAENGSEYKVQFIDENIEKSANYEMETLLEKNTAIQFDHPDKGQMTFKKLNDSTFLIIHQFNTGIAKTKMVRK